MLRRALASLSRPFARLSNFLRHAWLGRVPLPPAGHSHDWATLLRLSKKSAASGKRPARPTFRPSAEMLETRETPDDLFSLLQTGLGVGLMTLSAPLLTPLSAASRGWNGGVGLGAPIDASSSGPPLTPLLMIEPATHQTAPLASSFPSAQQSSAATFAAFNGMGIGIGLGNNAPALMRAPTQSGDEAMKSVVWGDWLNDVQASLGLSTQQQPSPKRDAPDSNGGGGGGGGGGGSAPSGLAIQTNVPGAPVTPANNASDARAAMNMLDSKRVSSSPSAKVVGTSRTKTTTSSTQSLSSNVLSNEQGGASPGQDNGPQSAIAHMAPNYGKTPLTYEWNVGQLDPEVRFASRSAGFQLFLTDTSAVFAVARPGEQEGAGMRDAFKLNFALAGTQPEIWMGDQLTTRSNYFIGNDSSQWHANVQQYASVIYKNVSPGIDLVFGSQPGGGFEYDYKVAPGADISALRLQWEGLQSTTVDPQGRLLLQTEGGTVIQDAPVVYQQGEGGARQNVSVSTVSYGDGTFGFSVGDYDHSKGLVVDPPINFATYLGGSGDDKAFGVDVDAAGNAYVTGSTTNSSFPHTMGGIGGSTTGVFVSKLSAQGGLVWSTYFGGSSVGTPDQGNGIAVGLDGSVYVVGQVSSTNFPTTAGAYDTSFTTTSGFVTRLSAAGDALLYSTYLSGSSAASLQGIAVDANGSAVVTGYSGVPLGGLGTAYPTTVGAFQTSAGSANQVGVLTKLNAAGSALVWSGYLVPNSASMANNWGYGVALDSSNNVYVGGSKTASGGNDAFVAKVSADGSTLNYSTGVAGTAADDGLAVAVDPSGNAYLTGKTASSNFPTTSGVYQTTLGSSTNAAFVTKVDTSGSISYSTYLRGTGVGEASQGNGIAVGADGQAIVVGHTTSSTFPTTSGAFQTSYAGSTDGFITRLNSTATSLVSSSYVGGSNLEQANAVALDPYGAAYVAGQTSSTNFPVVSGAYQGSNAGGSNDAFAMKVLPIPSAPVISSISTDSGTSSSDNVTTDQTLSISGTAPPSATVTLYRNDLGLLGSVAANGSGTFTYDYTAVTLPEGVYDFTATATDASGTSARSADFLVSIDLTAPTVGLTVPASTTSFAPKVRVTASDLYGVPNGTTVAVDVDLNNNASFADGGEASYATGTLTDGTVQITIPALSAAGTYPMRARVLDAAGTEGTSSTQTVVVTSVTSAWVATSQVLTVDPLAGNAQAQLGDVAVGHALDLDQSPGTGQSGNTALVYHSDWVSVKPIVQVSVPSVNNATLPTSITMRLTFNGTAAATVTYSTSGLSKGDVFTAALQAPNVISTTGRYGYSVLVQIPGQADQNITGAAYVVSEDASVFGAGWTLAGLDQLVSIAADGNGPAGMLRIYGSGGYSFYQGTSTYSSPAGDNGTLSVSGGTYTYSRPAGDSLTFNSGGNQTQWTSADGQETLQYRFDGTPKLTGLTAIDGALATFSYSGSLLQTVQAVNSRTTTVAFSGTNLTQITDPGSGTDTYTYDANHRVTSETFGGLVGNWAYASAGTVGTITQGSSTVGGVTNPSNTVVSAASVQGLSTLVAGTVYASFTDPLSHQTLLSLDASGRPVQAVAADGGITTWARDGNGWVTSQTDAISRTTTFALDAAGYVTLTTLPDSSTVSNSYQSSFHALTSTTDERGQTTTYTYDGSGHLLTVTNALSQTTTMGYTGGGLLQTVTDALNHTVTYAYDGSRRPTTVTDQLSHVTTQTYDSNGNPRLTTNALGNVTTASYDALGRLTSLVDAMGGTTSGTYDAAGLPLTSTDALGHVSSNVYDSFNRGWVAQAIQATGTTAQAGTLATFDAAGQASASRNANGWSDTSTFDSMARPVTTSDAVGNGTRDYYDLAGQLVATRDRTGAWTRYGYNSRGWQTTVTDALGNVTTTAYDAGGNVTQVTDPLTHSRSYAYDALGRRTVETDAAGKSVTTSYDAAGRVSTVTDQLSRVTSVAYDAANRQTRVTSAVGTGAESSRYRAYDAVGNATTETDGLGNVVTYSYDKANRATKTTDSLSHVMTTMFDLAGNVTATIDATGKQTNYAFDARNRQVARTDPLGNATTTVLDAVGSTIATLDPSLKVSQSVFDAAGRSVGSVDALGGVPLTALNAGGQPYSLRDSVGNQTSYVYDALGREKVRYDPSGNATTTTYDAAGRVSSVTDRDSRRQTYHYDNDNRVTAVTWLSSGGTTVNLLTYTYDDAGQMLTAADANGTVSYSYDDLGRVQAYTNVFGQALTYSYDAASHVTLRTDSLGGTLTSVYDANSQLTSRQFSGSGGTGTAVRVDFGYTNRGELSTIARYSNLAGSALVGTTAYSYDDASRVTAITNKDHASATLSYYNYSYDTLNRVSSQTYSSAVGTVTYSGTNTYTYDSTSQLLTDGAATYTYDLSGNRTMAGYATGTGNRLTNDGTWTYTYDNEGNLTGKTKGTGLETWFYGYDHANHMTSARQTSNGSTDLMTVTYAYDVQGNRVQEDKWLTGGSTVTTRFAYDGQHVWADLNGSNTLLVRYVYGDGTDQILTRTVASGGNAGVSAYLADNLGSVRDLQSFSTKAVIYHVEYTGFGVASESNPSVGDRYKYAGYQFEMSVGQYYVRARWYDPVTGRWMQQDPIGFVGGDGNLYRYAGNDATNGTDPSGLQPPALPTDPMEKIGIWHETISPAWEEMTNSPNSWLYWPYPTVAQAGWDLLVPPPFSFAPLGPPRPLYQFSNPYPSIYDSVYYKQSILTSQLGTPQGPLTPPSPDSGNWRAWAANLPQLAYDFVITPDSKNFALQPPTPITPTEFGWGGMSWIGSGPPSGISDYSINSHIGLAWWQMRGTSTPADDVTGLNVGFYYLISPRPGVVPLDNHFMPKADQPLPELTMPKAE